MMGYRAPSKKAIKDAIKGTGDTRLLNFWHHVQQTSMFGPEAKVPGQNVVVGPDAYNDRRWYATLTVDEHGKITKIT